MRLFPLKAGDYRGGVTDCKSMEGSRRKVEGGAQLSAGRRPHFLTGPKVGINVRLWDESLGSRGERWAWAGLHVD
jgi:hypothetical protein